MRDFTLFAPTDAQTQSAGPTNVVAAPVIENVTSPPNTSTSNAMSVGDTFSGSLETVGDDDWIAVTLIAGEIYDIDLFGSGAGALSDPYLRLYDGSGNQVAFNDDGGAGRNSQITFTPTTTGTYFISARAYNDAGGAPIRSRWPPLPLHLWGLWMSWPPI